MDSDKDMHDANDLESLDNNYYRGGTEDAAMNYYSDYNDDADDYFDEADDLERLESRRPEQNFTILKELDIQQRQEEDITRVATVLSISKVDANKLLHHYNWSVSKVHDAWFADEDRIREAFGLMYKPIIEHVDARELTCDICFENHPRAKIEMTSCRHPFCLSWWEDKSCVLYYVGYISTSITDGPGCLMLRCSNPTCGAAVEQDMIR
ncbi:putative E3 ubiquitin-protein ligase [Arachis hypogaea]|nr:putative E3 ubiquitin-protein ligase [Arachis hypogaea]